jgi:hypothetical protein
MQWDSFNLCTSFVTDVAVSFLPVTAKYLFALIVAHRRYI